MTNSSLWNVARALSARRVCLSSRSRIDTGRTVRPGFRSALVAGLALVGLSQSATAGTGGLTVDITALHAGQLSYSAPAPLQDAVGAFKVVINNPTNANVNNVYFRATTKSDSGGQAVFVQLPRECSQDRLVSADVVLGIVCKFSNLPAGSLPKEFLLKVRTPYAPSTPYSGDKFVLSYLTQAGQGADNTSNAVYRNSRVTELITQVKTSIISYVEQDATLDVWISGQGKTLVKPPKPATVEIKQNLGSWACLVDFRKCFTSNLKIVEPVKLLVDGQPVIGPDGNPIEVESQIQFAYPNWLVIDLVREKSTISKTATLEQAYVQLRYTGDAANSIPYIIRPCIVDSTIPLGWTINIPYDDRCVVPPSGGIAGGTYVDKSGQFHFRILGSSNGVIDW